MAETKNRLSHSDLIAIMAEAASKVLDERGLEVNGEAKPKRGEKAERIKEYLADKPFAPAREVADFCNCSIARVMQVKKELHKDSAMADAK